MEPTPERQHFLTHYLIHDKYYLYHPITNKLKKLDDKIAGRLGQLPMNNWESLPVDQKAVSSSSGKTLPSFTLNAAGSFGIAEMDAMTAAVVDSAKIRLWTMLQLTKTQIKRILCLSMPMMTAV